MNAYFRRDYKYRVVEGSDRGLELNYLYFNKKTNRYVFSEHNCNDTTGTVYSFHRNHIFKVRRVLDMDRHIGYSKTNKFNKLPKLG